MVIEVRLHEMLKKYAPNSNSGILTADVAEDMTVGELLQELELDEQEIQRMKVNHEACTARFILQDGDQLDLYPD
ncbi:MAG: MoaD/ThiS family protein [Sporomusaceae bacterium]|nr:MoaD/ThiS family protein [Sporomusaceae bacterium]